MEDKNIKTSNHQNRVWSGLIILVIGVAFLLRNFGVSIPDWIFSWHTILLGIGLFVGFKRNFNGAGWLVMVVIGGYFTIANMSDFDLSKYYFAVIFIILGLYLILKPKGNSRKKDNANFEAYTSSDLPSEHISVGKTDKNAHDILESVNVFGGGNQKVYSKNFKGGEVIAVFGGCEINLTQADFEDAVIVEIVAIFGGVKIVIPPTWEVKSEVAAIFGGMDDKRALTPFGDGPRKILIIKGVALFGGVEIRNY